MIPSDARLSLRLSTPHVRLILVQMVETQVNWRTDGPRGVERSRTSAQLNIGRAVGETLLLH